MSALCMHNIILSFAALWNVVKMQQIIITYQASHQQRNKQYFSSRMILMPVSTQLPLMVRKGQN